MKIIATIIIVYIGVALGILAESNNIHPAGLWFIGALTGMVGVIVSIWEE